MYVCMSLADRNVEYRAYTQSKFSRRICFSFIISTKRNTNFHHEPIKKWVLKHFDRRTVNVRTMCFILHAGYCCDDKENKEQKPKIKENMYTWVDILSLKGHVTSCTLRSKALQLSQGLPEITAPLLYYSPVSAFGATYSSAILISLIECNPVTLSECY